MEELKTFECAVCGKLHKSIADRVKCETQCLENERHLAQKLEAEAKEKAKKEAVNAINKEVDALEKQYDKVAKMIDNFYKTYKDEDLYDKVIARYIPKTFFDFFF